MKTVRGKLSELKERIPVTQKVNSHLGNMFECQGQHSRRLVPLGQWHDGTKSQR